MEAPAKRVKSMINQDADNNDDDVGVVVIGSSEIDHSIDSIIVKIDQYTQQVSEILEAGKNMLKNLSVEFEERLILIHKEQVEKWQDEIRELQLRNARNEETRAMLEKAQHLLSNPKSPTHEF